MATRRLLLAILGFALVAGSLSATPAESPCEFEGVDRIVAIGDIHGAFDQFVEILRAAGLVDHANHWAGGKTHFVQLGDVLDRGADSRKALDLIQALTHEAARAGGRVHSLLGNHEAMRMLGDLRYITPGEYAAFVTNESEAVRRAYLESNPPEKRAEILGRTPLGMVELIRAFGPKGAYGSLLRTLNTVERIDGVLFMHGGLSPAVSSMSCHDINDTIRRELSTDITATRTTPLESLTAREDGPLWYRGLAQQSDDFAPQVDAILAAEHARAIVVGHTVEPKGRIVARFGGRVFLIDTGMNPVYVPTGAPSALEIRGDVFTAIYRDRRDVLRRTPATLAR